MAERYEDFDRDRERERGRDAGQRYEDYRREWRGEGYGQGGSREYEMSGRTRDYGREREGWRGGEGYGSESQYGGRYGTQSSEYGQGSSEDWRSREDWRARERGGHFGQNLGGGMGSYSGQDWRTQRYGTYGGGMGTYGGASEGYGRQTWEGERGYGERWGQQGYGQESRGPNLYGQGYGQGRFAGRGPKGYQRSDERIREDVCEMLTRNPDVDASEIEVQVMNGEVTLTGTVDDRRQKRIAEEIVENLSGVREVNNQLRISRSLGQRMGEALGMSSPEDRNTTTTTRQNEPVTSRR